MLHNNPHEESKISQDKLNHEIKIATDFDFANSVRHKNKVLTLKTRYIVIIMVVDYYSGLTYKQLVFLIVNC